MYSIDWCLHTIRICLFIAIMLASPCSLRATDLLRTVALTGDSLPVASDRGSFDFFTYPALNDSGEVAFRAFLAGRVDTRSPDEGVFSEAGGLGLQTVALRGDPAPGVEGDAFFGSLNTLSSSSAFGKVGIGDTGETIFVIGLAGDEFSTLGNTAIFRQHVGEVAEPVAIERDLSPSTSILSKISDPDFNSSGHVAVASEPFVPLPSIVAIDSLFSDAGGGMLTARASTDDVVPLTTPTIAYDRFSGAVLNDRGDIAVQVSLKGDSSLTHLNRGAIAVSNNGGPLEILFRDGERAPHTEEGVTLLGMGVPEHNGPEVGRVVISEGDDIAFRANLVGGRAGANSYSRDFAVYSGSGHEDLRLVARTGDLAPQMRHPFDSIDHPAINLLGRTAFAARTKAGNSQTDDAIFSEGATGILELVAREGDVAPGTSSSYTDFAFPTLTLNDRGQLAFIAEFGEGFVGGTGIFAQDQAGVVRLIAREGGQIDVSNDPLNPDIRTISGQGFTDQGLFYAGAFNNRGQVAFAARFTDGSSGIFVSDAVAIPEPSTLLIASLALVILPLRVS